MIEVAATRARPLTILLRTGIVLLVLAFVASIPVGLLAGRVLLHRGEVMPGVSLLGADLSGLSAEEVAVRIRELTARRLSDPVTLSVEGKTIAVEPSKLFLLDRTATAARTLETGRESWRSRLRSLLSPLTDPVEVEPVLVQRPAAASRLDGLLERFGTPPVSATVVMEGLEPVVRSSKPGRQPDLATVLGAIRVNVLDGATVVPVTLGPAAPAVDDEAARQAAAEARLVVSGPIALEFDARRVGTLTPPRLARLLAFTERGSQVLPLFDRERAARVLDHALAPWKRQAVNARFAVAGKRVRILPSRPGLGLDVSGGVASLTTAARRTEDRTAELRLTAIQPDRTTAEAHTLGIRERVSTFTTEMGPSSSNRIHNVHLMADYIDGTIIEPGQTFSFNAVVGPRTPERGFLEGQMIVGSLLLPSIGGGVCQTATTLFNNAFELGLPISKRFNHSFYISHYPVGRDATVSWGGPDLVFRNDLANALLIKTTYTSATLTFSFYGAAEGRTVTSSTGPKTNWRSPRLTYALDPAAPRGSVRLERGSHQSGFDVTVYRRVTLDGKLLRKDSFTSKYIAVGDTAVYGPGRQIPGPYFVIPST